MTTKTMTIENEKKLQILSAFLKIYPSSRLDDEGLLLYVLMLSEVSVEELQIAMQKIAMHSKFYPSVSEILDSVECMRQTLNPSCHIPSVDEAWYEVTRQMQIAYPYKKPVFSTPEIAEAVRNMGWRLICETPAGDMNIVRAHFRDIYKNMLKRKRDDWETQAILAALPSDKRGRIVERALLAAKTM